MLPALVALLLAAVPPMTGGIRINEPDDQRWAWFVEGAGLDTVQVTIYADQVHWDGADLEYSYLAWAGLPGLIAEVQAAQARGLQVMLVLRVKLDLFRAENRHLWHGMIWPRDEALEAWFARYRAFTLFWADWATRLGVDALVIGHEEGYGVWLPGLDDTPPAFAARARTLRQRAAGQHALRMFREERGRERLDGAEDRSSRSSSVQVFYERGAGSLSSGNDDGSRPGRSVGLI